MCSLIHQGAGANPFSQTPGPSSYPPPAAEHEGRTQLKMNGEQAQLQGLRQMFGHPPDVGLSDWDVALFSAGEGFKLRWNFAFVVRFSTCFTTLSSCLVETDGTAAQVGLMGKSCLVWRRPISLRAADFNKIC